MTESYLRPQRWLSAKDGQALDLTASLHPGPPMGYGNGRSYYKGKFKVDQCSHTLKWHLTGADEVDTVSQRPSVVMTSLNTMYSSAVKGHCAIKAKKNQGSPERMNCLLLESKQWSTIPFKIFKTLMQSTNNLSPYNETMTHTLECSQPNQSLFYSLSPLCTPF